MISIRELEAHLDEYVKRATHGESVVIADDGKPVAELVPPPTPVTDHLLELARQGRVVLPTRPRFIPDLNGATMGPGQSLTDILLEERRDDRLLR
jgi:prevent-host-death family protein